MNQKAFERESGQALVEMALVLLLLLLFAFAILDFGRAIYQFSVVYNSAREGARYGAIPIGENVYRVPIIDGPGIIIAVRDRAVGLDIPDGNIDIHGACGVYNLSSPPDPNNCVVPSSKDALYPSYYYLWVTVHSTFIPITPLISGVFGNSIDISSTSLMKIEK